MIRERGSFTRSQNRQTVIIIIIIIIIIMYRHHHYVYNSYKKNEVDPYKRLAVTESNFSKYSASFFRFPMSKYLVFISILVYSPWYLLISEHTLAWCLVVVFSVVWNRRWYYPCSVCRKWIMYTCVSSDYEPIPSDAGVMQLAAETVSAVVWSVRQLHVPLINGRVLSSDVDSWSVAQNALSIAQTLRPRSLVFKI